jgi:ATP-dependent Clp protease ATP-binding subunit ClpA
MTSNIGSDIFKKHGKPLGFTSGDAKAETDTLKKDIVKNLENTLSPEFLNRIDDIIVFSPLTMPEVRGLTYMYIEKIKGHLEEYGKQMTVTEKAVDALVSGGYNEKYGARFLKRHVDETVKVPITLKWKEGDLFTIDAEDGEVLVEASPVGEPALM